MDLTLHSVPLDQVYFDTFDGGAVPLDAAAPELIERLRDAIPPIDNPRYGPLSAGDWLNPDDPVVGYVAGDQAYAYPVRILNLHEILNDTISGIPVLVSYCPLCRSAIVYDRRLEGRTLSFGNTSALYENDLVMLDRDTGSYWYQVAGEAIVGELTGARLEPLPSTMATWSQWSQLHPGTLVLTRDTGLGRNYDRDPFVGYEDFLNAGSFPFPVAAPPDGRLAPADLVLGVGIADGHKVYPLAVLGDAAVNDMVADVPIVVFSAVEGPTGAAYSPVVDGERLLFEYSAGAWRDVGTGSAWTLDGEATSGPLAGTRLDRVPNRITFWFAYVGAFPQAEVTTVP